MKSSIFVAAVLIFYFQISFLPTIHCRVFLPTAVDDDTLIKATCRLTPNYDLCVFSLTRPPATPDSLTEDKRGLALIMASKVLEAKVREPVKEVKYLINQGYKNDSLRTCLDFYRAIIDFHIEQQAVQAINGVQNIQAAIVAMDDIVGLVNECGNGLGRSFLGSPIEGMNASVVKLAIITKAIVQQLP